MNAELWSRLEEVFAGAAGLDGEEQAVFLDGACGADTDLRRRIEDLLSSDRVAEGFLEAAVEAGASALATAPEGLAAGRCVGAYRVIRELGRGGMSSVYLARRADHEFHKRVAIKVMRRGMDTEDILRRFHSERQILASLDHPNIARFYDGGTTDDSRPYFVMEYIDGLPIHEYCDRHRLPVRRRLELFRRVCSAVHYAHRNLVVHRDLKPRNVLVTAEGVAKLLDFGIAKLLNPDLSCRAVDPTAAPLRLMTPGYASPEQTCGGPVTTATDVYSLGVLLYELLTGHRPYSRRARDVDRPGRDEPPERPSAAVSRREEVPAPGERGPAASGPEEVSRDRGASPEQLRRLLRGDLDNIVLMALREEPERRYGSVEQLAEDLERHLTGHPVIARRDTIGYRAAKFVRRHRLGVALAAGVAILTLAFAVAMSVQSSRVRRERDRAAQVSEMLVDLFGIADSARGSTITARELLDRGAQEVRDLDESPETAMLMETLAWLYEKLGLYRSAAPLYERALAIRRIVGEENSEVAEDLNSVGRILALQGEFARAEPMFREALELRFRLFGDEHPKIGSSLNNLALILHDLGDYRRAEPIYRRALEMDSRLLGESHPSTATTLSNLALLLYDEGSYGEAERLSREVLGLRRRRLEPDDPLVALSLDHLGRVLHARGAYAEAEPLLRRAFELRRVRLGDHAEVARSLHSLGDLLRDQGRLEEAERHLRRALELRRSLLGGRHPEVAASLESMARLVAARGEGEEAEELFRRAVAMYGAALPQGHPLEARARLGLGELLEARGECGRAEPFLRRALELRRRVLPAGNWQIAEVESVLGGCLAAGGRLAEAGPLVEESYRMLRTHLGPEHERTRRALARREVLGRPGF